MRQEVRYQLWIVAAAGVIFFTNLGQTALWDMDEALYTTCAREMFQRGNWVVPWFNGEMFPEKPPLMFWTMMAGFELFGVNEFGARFFSAVFGVATALAAFHLGRILGNVRVGLWTGLITASTIIFTVSARAATVDSALTLATTLAFLLFVIARYGGATAAGGGSSCTAARGSWPAIALMYACIGVAVLAKGPVGMVLPLAAMGLFLLAADGWRNLFRSAWSIRPLTGLLVMAAVALPWYVWVGVRTDGEWLRRFFLEFNLRPFKQPIQGHGAASSLDQLRAAFVSILYYFFHVPAILVGFFPWSVFLGPTLVDTFQRSGRRDAWRDGCVLASCWFGVWFVFWSICKTKLPHYLLPAYPALALLTACFVDRWQTEPASLARWWLRNAWISMILVGVGMMIALPLVAAKYLPGEASLGLVGLIPLLGGGWCWWKTAHGRHNEAVIAFTVTAVIFLTAIFGFAALRVDGHQNAEPMIVAIRADSGRSDAVPIATYRFFRESTVYYAGHPVTKCDDGATAHRSARQQLQEFLATSNRSYVITTSEYLPEIEGDFPGRFHAIFRQRRFLSDQASDEMVVLRWGPEGR
jgi:4-amino-4-deoxy-L-arabinose transferase-like glycosyltransferase